MSPEKLRDFLETELGFSRESAEAIARDARGEHVRGRNLSIAEKYVLDDKEKVLDQRLNRVAAMEAMQGSSISEQAKTDFEGARERALASDAKQLELARRVKAFGQRKKMTGHNSDEYEALKEASAALLESMNRLHRFDAPKGVEREKLLRQMESQAEKLNKVADDYVQLRGKGKENPGFSTKAGGVRYHAAFAMRGIGEQIVREVKLVREAARDYQREAIASGGSSRARVDAAEKGSVSVTSFGKLSDRLSPAGSQRSAQGHRQDNRTDQMQKGKGNVL